MKSFEKRSAYKFPHAKERVKVLYMSFDKFLLAVESRDVSQADKILIKVSSFPKLCDCLSTTDPELSAK